MPIQRDIPLLRVVWEIILKILIIHSLPQCHFPIKRYTFRTQFFQIMSDVLFSSWKKLFISATNCVIQFVTLLLVINHNIMILTVIQN